MSNETKIDSADGLVSWCKSVGSEVKLQRKGAGIIMDYLSENGKELLSSPEGKLFFSDHAMSELTTIDDVVDLVCEWNYEKLSDTRDKKENPDNFIDFCNSSSLEKQLEEKQAILDRIFSQTVYGRDAVAIAHNLAMETMKSLKLVPTYDIPMVEEVGVYRTVSENIISYPSEEREDIVKAAEESVLTVKEDEAVKEDVSSVIVATEPVKAAEDKEVVQEKQEDREQGRSR